MSFIRDAIRFFLGERDIRDNLPLLPLDLVDKSDYIPTAQIDSTYPIRGLAASRGKVKARRMIGANPKLNPVRIAKRNQRPRQRENRWRRIARKFKEIL